MNLALVVSSIFAVGNLSESMPSGAFGIAEGETGVGVGERRRLESIYRGHALYTYAQGSRERSFAVAQQDLGLASANHLQQKYPRECCVRMRRPPLNFPRQPDE